MNASLFVGRVGGLSVALGIGTALIVGGAGSAWADSTDSSATPSKYAAAQRVSKSPRTTKPAPAPAAAAARAAAPSSAQVAVRTSRRLTGPAAKATAAATNTNPVAALLFNETPALSWTTNPGQSRTGIITGNLLGTDGEDDPLTYTLASGPGNGTVSIDAGGSYTYTPSEFYAYTGTADSFIVTASDAGAGFHLHGIAGLLNLLTFGLLGFGGHTTTVTVPVQVAAWKRYNSAPTATATVGSPDPATGSVLGQVVGSDPDGDALAYSAASYTGKGTVAIDSVTGVFSYTPATSARGIAVGTDTVVVTVADGNGGSTPITVAVPVAAWAATNSMIRYAFNFTGGSQYWTAEALRALQFAADKVASYIVVAQPVTLTFNIDAYSSPELATLASAGSGQMGRGPGFYGTIVQNKLLRGIDLNRSAADGTIGVNFGTSWSFADTVGSAQHDFVTVMMHEMMHAYGFTSSLVLAGSNADAMWAMFDSAVVDRTGARVVDDSYRFNAALHPNLTGQNGGLYFAGSNAVAAYGGLVPLYTPNQWNPGSAVSHLDDQYFWGSTAQLMNPSVGGGPGVRVLSPVEQGILADLGYTVAAPR